MEYVSFRTCIKPLRNVHHLTLDVPFSWTETLKNSFFTSQNQGLVLLVNFS